MFVGLVHFVAPIKVVDGDSVTLTVYGDSTTSGFTARCSVGVDGVLGSSGALDGVVLSDNLDKVVCGLTEGILGVIFTVVSVCGETVETKVEMMTSMGVVEAVMLALVAEVTDAVLIVVSGTITGTLMPKMNKYSVLWEAL